MLTSMTNNYQMGLNFREPNGPFNLAISQIALEKVTPFTLIMCLLITIHEEERLTKLFPIFEQHKKAIT